YTTVIDDTYNSSPVAVAEALRTLAEVKVDASPSAQDLAQDDPEARPRGRKIAVLGDMLELGKYSIKAHEKAGKEAVGAADILVTVGLRARDIAMGALDNGMDEKNIFQFDDTKEAGKHVETIMAEGDIVLVKGSQGMRMERIVEEIMAHPEDKDILLVRQEEEWQKWQNR
ncbi:MAG: cyanophycin synthetase, partial [bacterium]|nr:cyanophycin synthetase [bacterium]